jgi:hypothetical protein
MTCAAIKSIFEAEPGTKVRMRVESDGEPPREVTLTLRDLL